MSTKSKGIPLNTPPKDPVPSLLGRVRIRHRPADYGARNGNDPRVAPAQASNAKTTSAEKADANERARQIELGRQLVDPASITTKTENRSGDSEVGYKRPPVSNRFKKGQTGNSKGRPKGSRNLRTILEEESQKSVEITENGRIRKISKRELAVISMINQAAKGDPKALQTFLRLEEKYGSLAPDDRSPAEAQDPSLAEMVRMFLEILRPDEPDDPDSDT